MRKYSLVICTMNVDEDGFSEIEVFDNVTGLLEITDIIEETQCIEFHMNNEDKCYEYDTIDMEWYRFVPQDSHLASYARNNDKYECEWDNDGNKL